MPKPRVVLLDTAIHPNAQALLREACEVVALEAYTPVGPLIEAAREADAILVRRGRVPAEVLEACPRLCVVARHGVGVDEVDLAAASRLGIMVTNTPYANATTVAEFTLGMVIDLARGLHLTATDLDGGQWLPGARIGFELEGRTLGLVGLGTIGRRVAVRAKGLGMRVLATDPAFDAAYAARYGARLVAYDELLAASDIVSLHVRLTPETRYLVDRAAIARMPPGAFLINTSRGGVVDEAALIEALEAGHLAGAGIDTFEEEPLPADHPMVRAPRVLRTPHVAGQTHEAMQRAAMTAARCILDAMAGREPAYVYNAEALEGRRREVAAAA
ncbi:MAG: hypothetical protein EA356_06815 [Geminicoccaceae bacterium]|nr:MAG: hypothetical protein EA356_06815 [Geminicoccaceae bacterium]